MKRHSPELIDIDWLCDAITKAKSAVKLSDICAKAKYNHEGRILYEKISENTFRKAAKLHSPIPYNPKKGRKQEEINLDAAQAFCNFKDQMSNAGINKIIQKLKTDVKKLRAIQKNLNKLKKIPRKKIFLPQVTG